MARSSITLEEFLRELAAQRGMHRKVRLIARYWRQVQRLPAEERERVALALGSEAAWRRLERLFLQDGTLSEGELEVKRALDSVGRADPRELRDLAKRIRAGDYVDVGRDLTEVVGRALEEEATEAAGPDAPAGEGRDPEAAEADEPPEDPGDGSGLGMDAAKSVPANVGPTTEPEMSGRRGVNVPAPGPAWADEELEPVDRGEIAEEPESPPPASVGAEPEPVERAEKAAKPGHAELTEAVEPEPIRSGETPARPETAYGAAIGEPGREPADATLSAAERLGVLRRLRGKEGLAIGLGRDGRARLLQRLGPGWASRRALSQMIRGRQLDGLEEALRLTKQLSSPIQETWCLGDLVEHWNLDDDEIARVLGAAPTPASRRRLERRAHRARSSGQ